MESFGFEVPQHNRTYIYTIKIVNLIMYLKMYLLRFLIVLLINHFQNRIEDILI